MNSIAEPANAETAVHIKISSEIGFLKWSPLARLKINTFVRQKDNLGFYTFKHDQPPTIKLLAPISGKITFIEPAFTKNFEHPTDYPTKASHLKVLCRLEACRHRIIYNGTCTDCFEPCAHHQTFKIVNHIENVSTDRGYVEETIQAIRQQKKLVLLLDIDNTILHAFNSSYKQIEIFLSTKNLKVDEFLILRLTELEGYIVKVRPFLLDFLSHASQKFNIIVYTFGSRSYATAVLSLIDPEQRFLNVSLEAIEYDYS